MSAVTLNGIYKTAFRPIPSLLCLLMLYVLHIAYYFMYKFTNITHITLKNTRTIDVSQITKTHKVMKRTARRGKWRISDILAEELM